MSFKGTERYVATADLQMAVNAAVVLQRPLLIKGEPGTGKTMLAEEVARSLGRPLLQWHIKSTTKAQDGLYVYDAVQRDLRTVAYFGWREESIVQPLGKEFAEELIKMGVPPRAEIATADQAKYFLDMGVRHFSVGTDITVLHQWWSTAPNATAVIMAMSDNDNSAALARPGESGTTPTIHTGSRTGLRWSLASRSVPMLPGPIRAHLIFLLMFWSSSL